MKKHESLQCAYAYVCKCKNYPSCPPKPWRSRKAPSATRQSSFRDVDGHDAHVTCPVDTQIPITSSKTERVQHADNWKYLEMPPSKLCWSSWDKQLSPQPILECRPTTNLKNLQTVCSPACLKRYAAISTATNAFVASLQVNTAAA